MRPDNLQINCRISLFYVYIFVRDWTSIVMNIYHHLEVISECRMRLLAESKGYRLDDTGLFPATQASGGKRVSWRFHGNFLITRDFRGWIRQYVSILLQGARASASLRFDNEKEVFDFLGFPWLEPHERNLWNAFSLCELATQRPNSRGGLVWEPTDSSLLGHVMKQNLAHFCSPFYCQQRP